MKAHFITTQTNDTHNLIDAWDSASETPATRFQYNYLGMPVDGQMVDAAEQAKPDVIFYVGAWKAQGLPKPETFRRLRKIAPMVNLCPDAVDAPWHGTLALYRSEQCFDLQVGLDGGKDSPVDLATVTPVDWRPFCKGTVKKDIRCGFSGNTSGKRARLLGGLGSRCFLRMRGDDYLDHVNFLRRCRIVFNTAYTGSGQLFHVKGRAIEAGWAGAALLEYAGSPTKDWFPAGTFFTYRDVEDARALVDTATDEAIASCAAKLSAAVRANYHPGMIYGQMLERLGLVGHSLSIQTS